MTSVFDYDDSLNAAYQAKTAGKNLVTAKHEVLTKTGEFLFLAHTDKEFALRCQMVESDIESAARRKMATVSDSKFKLVRALHEEWKIRHANCTSCKVASTDTHNFGNNVGSCATCKGATGHKSGKGWHCPSGAGCQAKTAHAGQKDTTCDECGATLTDGSRADDVRGHLDICSKHLKKSSKAVEKMAALEERFAPREAMAYSPNQIISHFISKGGANSELGRIVNDPEHQQTLADPSVAAKHKEGDYVLIHKFNPDGSHKDVTLGRLLGATKGGSPDLSDVNCNGSTHEGYAGCQCGGRHYHVAEIGAMNPEGVGNHVYPANIVEGANGEMQHYEAPETTGFVPAHHLTALPEGNSANIHDFLDQHAQTFGYDVNGKHPLHDAESTKDQGAFVRVMGYARKKMAPKFKNVGQIVGYTTNRSTPTHAYSEDAPSGPRSEAKDSYQLEHGPRDFSGSSSQYTEGGQPRADFNPEFGSHLDPSAAGSGKILPIIHGAFRKQTKGGTRLTRMFGGGTLPDGSGEVPVGFREESRIGSFGTDHEAGRTQVVQPATPGADNQDWQSRQSTFNDIRRRGMGGAGAANPTNAPAGRVPNFTKMFGPKNQ